MINEKITLYNGVKVPVLGLGTWMIDDDKVKEVVVEDVREREFKGVGGQIRNAGDKAQGKHQQEQRTDDVRKGGKEVGLYFLFK